MTGVNMIKYKTVAQKDYKSLFKFAIYLRNMIARCENDLKNYIWGSPSWAWMDYDTVFDNVRRAKIAIKTILKYLTEDDIKKLENGYNFYYVTKYTDMLVFYFYHPKQKHHTKLFD